MSKILEALVAHVWQMHHAGHTARATDFLIEASDTAKTAEALTTIAKTFCDLADMYDRERKDIPEAERRSRGRYPFLLNHALSTYKRASELEPDNFGAAYEAARVAKGLSMHASAFEYARKALGINPMHPEAWDMLESLHLSRDEMASALVCRLNAAQAREGKPKGINMRVLSAVAYGDRFVHRKKPFRLT